MKEKLTGAALCHGHSIGMSSCSGALQDVTMAAGTDNFLLQAITSLMPAGASCVLGLGNSISEVEMRTPVSSSQLRTAMPRQELINIILFLPYSFCLPPERHKQTGDPDPWRMGCVSPVISHTKQGVSPVTFLLGLTQSPCRIFS